MPGQITEQLDKLSNLSAKTNEGIYELQEELSMVLVKESNEVASTTEDKPELMAPLTEKLQNICKQLENTLTKIEDIKQRLAI